MSGGTVLFRSPRGDRGVFVRIGLPPDFDETQFRRVDDLAKQVYEIANETGPARFVDYPIDNTGLVALMVAQKCCNDEAEWSRVTDMSRAVLHLKYGENINGRQQCVSLNDASMKFVREKMDHPM